MKCLKHWGILLAVGKKQYKKYNIGVDTDEKKSYSLQYRHCFHKSKRILLLTRQDILKRLFSFLF